MEERTYVSVYIIKLKLTKDKQDQYNLTMDWLKTELGEEKSS